MPFRISWKRVRATYYYELGENITNTIKITRIKANLFRSDYYENLEVTDLKNTIKSCVFMKRGYVLDHLTDEMHDRLSERLAEALVTHETAGEAQFFKIKDPAILSDVGIINAPCGLAIKHRHRIILMQAQVFL